MFKVEYRVLPHKEIHSQTFATEKEMDDWIKSKQRLGIEVVTKSSK